MATDTQLAAILRDGGFAASSESDSKFYSVTAALASRLDSNLADAMRNQASALAMVFSKSLARRRLRPSQAKVRSITQRLGRGSKPRPGLERVTISILQRPNAAAAL